ncbi:MAG TPA: hypothetical protein VF163_07065 [Micromonosporaceae bacterium]
MITVLLLLVGCVAIYAVLVIREDGQALISAAERSLADPATVEPTAWRSAPVVGAHDASWPEDLSPVARSGELADPAVYLPMFTDITRHLPDVAHRFTAISADAEPEQGGPR